MEEGDLEDGVDSGRKKVKVFQVRGTAGAHPELSLGWETCMRQGGNVSRCSCAHLGNGLIYSVLHQHLYCTSNGHSRFYQLQLPDWRHLQDFGSF